MLSVVIPTLNAAETLPDCLAALRPGVAAGLVSETVVSDGGSSDGSAALARDAGAIVTVGSPGRGGQLQRGALASRGEWMLFLHADTVLAGDWLFAAEAFVAEADNRRRAGYFRFSLDDDAAAAKRLARLVAWRCRRLGLPFGDQGLLLSRLFYRELGGYRDLPLMEDVDIVRRIGRRRLQALPVDAVTSARRYRRQGYLLRPARNLLCLGLYFLGLPPAVIARLYR